MKNKSSLIIAVTAIVVSAVVAIVAIINNNNKGEQPREDTNSQVETGDNQGGSSDTGAASQTVSIVGKWKYDDSDLGDAFVYNFNADGTGNYTAAGDFTYEIDGNNISITYDTTGATFDTEFEINGDKLNIKDSAGSDTWYKKTK